MPNYPTKNDKELLKAFSILKKENEAMSFIRDLMTPAEIEEFSKRFQIAKLLWTTTKSYIEIAELVQTSTTTVTRVSHWLFKESWNGYRNVLEKMFGKSKR